MSDREWELNYPDWLSSANPLVQTNTFQSPTQQSNLTTPFGGHHLQCQTRDTTLDRPLAVTTQVAVTQAQVYNQPIQPQSPVPGYQHHQQSHQYNTQQADQLRSQCSKHKATASSNSFQPFSNPLPASLSHQSQLKQIHYFYQQPHSSHYNQYSISKYPLPPRQDRPCSAIWQDCASYSNNCGWQNSNFSTTQQRSATFSFSHSSNTTFPTQTSGSNLSSHKISHQCQIQPQLSPHSHTANEFSQKSAALHEVKSPAASPPWVLNLRANLDQLAEDHNKELLHWVVILNSFYEDIEREIGKIQKLQCAFLNTKAKLRRSTQQQRIIQQHDGFLDSQWNGVRLVTGELSTFLVYLPHQISADIAQGKVPLQHLGRQITQGMVRAAQSIVNAHH